MEVRISRITRLQRQMAEHGIDALLCLKPQNSYYLSGFNPVIYSHPVVAILPQEGEPILLVHALRDDHARQSAWVRDIRLFGAWSTKKAMGMDWLTCLNTILAEYDVENGVLGVEMDFLPVAILRQFEARMPNARFTDASELILSTRMVKDPTEIEQIRMAAHIADVGMEAAIAAAADRKSEQAVSVEAMTAMNRCWIENFPSTEVADFGNLEGGVFNGLWCYCLTGERVAFNCDVPSSRVLADGEIALIVIWTNCNGLHVENERAVAIGKLDQLRQRAYDAVLQVRAEGQGAMRPGATCAEVYGAAKVVYERLGYGSYLPGRIGHGMGLAPHEHPSLGPNDHTALVPGMVLTYEPNLRIPEFGGLQHSDTVLVTENGYESLTHTRRGFIQV